MFCLVNFTPFSEYVEEIYQLYLGAESSNFLNLDAAVRELKSSAPPTMNSMLAKHCNNHCSKSTKTCPSYVTKKKRSIKDIIVRAKL